MYMYMYMYMHMYMYRKKKRRKLTLVVDVKFQERDFEIGILDSNFADCRHLQGIRSMAKEVGAWH